MRIDEDSLQNYEEFNKGLGPSSLVGLPDIIEEVTEDDTNNSKFRKFKVKWFRTDGIFETDGSLDKNVSIRFSCGAWNLTVGE